VTNTPSSAPPVLDVADLHVGFATGAKTVRAVRGVSLTVGRSEVLGLVGESGCGKSTTVLAVPRLLPGSATISARRLVVDGIDLAAGIAGAIAEVRGKRLGMVFQDPTASLNPAMRIGRQVAEPLRIHAGLSRVAAGRRAVELLAEVGIPEPARRAEEYPHRLSGGQRQRVAIAAAIACKPALVFADEATTALDVTVQAEILDLLRSLRVQHGTSFLFVTHDLGVVAEFADRVSVMYAGRVVETGPVRSVLRSPRHPYTSGLLACVPRLGHGRPKIAAIPGQPPDLAHSIVGCAFRVRCRRAIDRCAIDDPQLEGSPHAVACWNPNAAIGSTGAGS
jgi:oligopeptide/dipeptide ABC transporter ATP-binding protein